MAQDARKYLYRVTLPWACFGLVVRGYKVIEAAPIGRYSLGRDIRDVCRYYKKRGATITRMELDETV